LVDPTPLTKEEEQKIIDYIKADKELRGKISTKKKRIRNNLKKKLIN